MKQKRDNNLPLNEVDNCKMFLNDSSSGKFKSICLWENLYAKYPSVVIFAEDIYKLEIDGIGNALLSENYKEYSWLNTFDLLLITVKKSAFNDYTLQEMLNGNFTINAISIGFIDSVLKLYTRVSHDENGKCNYRIQTRVVDDNDRLMICVKSYTIADKETKKASLNSNNEREENL